MIEFFSPESMGRESGISPGLALHGSLSAPIIELVLGPQPGVGELPNKLKVNLRWWKASAMDCGLWKNG